jgi:hypothetical protein
MSLKNAFGIYQVIEKILKASKKPLTCVELFDFEEIRQYAEDTNKVSDYLGHMFRRGLLRREPVSKGSAGAARFAYTWKDPKLGTPIVPRSSHNRLNVVNLAERDQRLAGVEQLAQLEVHGNNGGNGNGGHVIYEEPAFRVKKTERGVKIETLHFEFSLTTK